MKRRYFLLTGLATSFSACASTLSSTSSTQTSQTDSTFEITKSEAEWRKILTSKQFEVLRRQGTEQAGSSPLVKEHRHGTFICAGCNLPLFLSSTKFESGTGWPSFFQPIDGAIGTTEDRSYMMVRTEVHCRRCGGHLGHVFDDGPQPTGKRYCMNGVALKFRPDSKKS